jgi:uncharacterized protein (TIGR02145 family)
MYMLSNLFQGTLLLALGLVLAISSCKEEEENKTKQLEYGTVNDFDENIYRTVKIGDNWWMAENLKVTKFRSGVSITQVPNANQWTTSQAAYCIYDNNTSAPGLLYNWPAANHPDGLAPEGWHIATEQDWKELELSLGLSSSETEKLNWRESGAIGDKLKVVAPTGWTIFGDVWGNNSSGFSALAGGCRLYNGTWANPGLSSCGYWWTSTEQSSEFAWFRSLDYKKSGIFRYYVQKSYGMSIRCVKDK